MYVVGSVHTLFLILHSDIATGCKLPGTNVCCYGFTEIDENCVECPPGYWGSNCSNTCIDGYYGDKCKQICHCSLNETCNFEVGCQKCAPGYQGVNCSVSCDDGFYGNGCKEECNCSVNEICSSTDGCSIEKECAPGYHGTRCSVPCDRGFYGYGCRERCNCSVDEQCNSSIGCQEWYMENQTENVTLLDEDLVPKEMTTLNNDNESSNSMTMLTTRTPVARRQNNLLTTSVILNGIWLAAIVMSIFLIFLYKRWRSSRRTEDHYMPAVSVTIPTTRDTYCTMNDHVYDDIEGQVIPTRNDQQQMPVT